MSEPCIKNFLNASIIAPEDCLILANSADPDEMQHYAAFYQGLHCSHGSAVAQW